jgi:hypothetical protein
MFHNQLVVETAALVVVERPGTISITKTEVTTLVVLLQVRVVHLEEQVVLGRLALRVVVGLEEQVKAAVIVRFHQVLAVLVVAEVQLLTTLELQFLEVTRHTVRVITPMDVVWAELTPAQEPADLFL